MRVSVIIPVYNGEDNLPDLLQCLRSQTYPPDQVEYIIVDNNSTDGTQRYLQTAIVDFQRDGLVLHLAIESKIQSSYAARNTGIRLATGELLAFTDADCRPAPQWLEQLMEPFNDPTIDLVIGEIDGLPSQNWLETYAEDRQVLSQKYTLEHSFCPYGQTANLAVKRSLFSEIGLFRPYLTTGGDADFCWRALKYSQHQYVFAPQALVLHRHRSTLRELAQQWQRYGRSNHYLSDLHGVDLMAKPQLSYQMYLLARWLMREIPTLILATLTGKLSGRVFLSRILSTPLSIYCNYNRFQGQTQAKLPALAPQIDRL
jgi:glycosyltransferase involved in cell wall biosynthesis